MFQQRIATGLSFTDCTSKMVIDDFGIDVVAAFDTHFHQFGLTLAPSILRRVEPQQD